MFHSADEKFLFERLLQMNFYFVRRVTTDNEISVGDIAVKENFETLWGAQAFIYVFHGKSF